MNKPIGQQLLEENTITEGQLEEALARQRLRGGRLGQNLVALGYLSPEKLDTFFCRYPAAPTSVEETGLELSFIADLIIKHILFMGEFRIADIVDSTKLPPHIVDLGIEMLRREKMVEVRGAAAYVRSSYKFIITEGGKVRGGELFDICRYAGPAPVPLESYREIVGMQAIRNIMVSEQSVHDAFSDFVISEKLQKRLGPAISSGHPIFIYGPPGNGKTSIAETIGQVLPDHVYLPYSIIVGGQIVNVFDAVNHVHVADDLPLDVDHRWVKIKRPVVITGGELSLRMLDLEFDPIAKFYEAPLQMKANNGLFIVDDFGRQQMDPQTLLNRWIINLDRKIDYLSLHTGMKFEIPFDQLVIFATNLKPESLVDDAFLRRLRYKICVGYPDEGEYKEIFLRVCRKYGLDYREEVVDYLLKNFYRKFDRPFNACHPRDIVELIIDESRYYNRPPELSKETIAQAWENYFVEQ